MDNTRSFRELFLRTVAIIGLIAVLVLGAWGIIIVASNLVGIFGSVGTSVTSLFTPASKDLKEKVVAVAPATSQTGQPLSISWTHDNKVGAYAYTVSYNCAAGLSVKATLPNNTMQTVACDTPFNFTNADSKMVITPVIAGNQSVPATFTIAAKKLSNGTVAASGSVNVSITPKAVASTGGSNTGGSQPTHTYVPAAQTTSLYGLPDLSVRMLSVIPQGNRVAVQFEIVNNGTNVARAGWTFNAQLPLTPAYTYQSQTQQALNPGDKIVYTLGFDNQNYNNNYNYQNQNSNCGYKTTYTYNGYTNIPSTVWSCDTTSTSYNTNYPSGYTGGSVTVSADPYNWVQESAEYNNTASIQL